MQLEGIHHVTCITGDAPGNVDFYTGVLGLRKLYRFGDLTFFDCAGVRLLLEKVKDQAELVPHGCIYFRCADIALAVAELETRGLAFPGKPHLIARMGDHDSPRQAVADFRRTVDDLIRVQAAIGHGLPPEFGF